MTATITQFRKRAKGSGVAFEPAPTAAQRPYRRETAAEIAARLRARIPATPMVAAETVKRPGDVVISSLDDWRTSGRRGGAIRKAKQPL